MKILFPKHKWKMGNHLITQDAESLKMWHQWCSQLCRPDPCMPYIILKDRKIKDNFINEESPSFGGVLQRDLCDSVIYKKTY